jgi:peptidoglycan/xylan/chitin deacetylase (PgdA/CDA1 family)
LIRDGLARRLLGPPGITRVETAERVVALTFDDGPHPESTPRLLALLERHRAQATFFMVGRAAARQPKLVGQVAAAGHVVGNHSWNHPSFHAIGRAERWRQLQACQRALGPFGRQRLFRPPYGHQNRALPVEARLLRYTVVSWSLDVQDWRPADPSDLAAKLIEGIRPGGIVLLHDAVYDGPGRAGPDPRSETWFEAMALMLDRLAPRFEFVSLPALLTRGRRAP